MIPPALKAGSRVAFVSPSGAIEPHLVEAASQLLTSWGLEVQVAPHALGKYHRFSATDSERTADLQNALDDPHIDAVWCTRGGYGLCRIIDRLSFDALRQHPKWIVGFSDITCLHGALSANHIASVHGIMCKHLAQQPDSRAVVALKHLLFGGNANYEVAPHESNQTGTIRGRLVGGNLSVLNGLIGTPYMHIPKGSILVIEDLCEAPYHIDRMLRELRLSGILDRLGGVIAGQFTDLDNDDSFADAYGILLEAIQNPALPVACNFPVGHVDDNLPLVLGAQATLSVTSRQVSLKQNIYGI